jgi:signal transduction histidine kinase
MIKKWWHDPIVWLMGASMILLFLLIGLWLQKSYQGEKEVLVRTTSHLFNNSIRELEDSLMREHFFNDVQLIPEDSMASHINHTQIHQDDTVRMVTVWQGDHKQRPNWRALRKRYKTRPHSDAVGALSFHLKLSRGDTLTPDFFDSTAYPMVLENINHQFAKKWAKEDYTFSYQIIPFADEAPDTVEGAFLTRPYLDLMSGYRFVNVYTGYKPYLIRAISSEILFSVFLAGMTFLAFFFTYRSLLRQRKLTLLKNDLISNITHELKTPITTVGVALEALSQFNAQDDPARRKEYLDISKNELKRLNLLVDNVLKTSVEEGREPKMRMEVIDLKDLISNILGTMKLHFSKWKAQVQFQSQGDAFKLEGDPVHLTSVLYNLLDNALKYSEGKPDIQIQLTDNPKHLILKIADRGIGIPKGYLSKVFEKFFRVPTDNRHNIKGHGLGLSYVARVIKQHKGTIEVTSEPGKGTEFTIKLPQKNGIH